MILAFTSVHTMLLPSLQPKDMTPPSDLLKPLADLCFVKTLDWWTYEVCHQKKVPPTPSPLQAAPCVLPCFTSTANAMIGRQGVKSQTEMAISVLIGV